MLLIIMKINDVQGDLTDVSAINSLQELRSIVEVKLPMCGYHLLESILSICYVSFYNSTASTWTLATPRTTWQSMNIVYEYSL